VLATHALRVCVSTAKLFRPHIGLLQYGAEYAKKGSTSIVKVLFYHLTDGNEEKHYFEAPEIPHRTMLRHIPEVLCNTLF
jgi:hypothetical protein